MKYSKRIWDSIAQDYDIIWEVPDYTPILQSIVQVGEVDYGRKVLDIATGTGTVCIEMAKKVGKYGTVLGIDYSKPMLQQASKKTKVLGLYNVDFILADAHNLPLLDSCFGAVTSCFTFAFLSSPQKAVKEMARVLRTRGKMVAVEWERPPIAFWAEHRKEAGIHDFPKSKFIKKLHNSGLRKIETKRIRILHRRPNIPKELIKKSQLISAAIMGLKENDAEEFFSKIREEHQRLRPKKKRGWLPILYVGTKLAVSRK